MTITTEFNKGDKVWFLDNSLNFEARWRLSQGEVQDVMYEGCVKYHVKDERLSDFLATEYLCAPSREALKAKLIDNINKLFEDDK